MRGSKGTKHKFTFEHPIPSNIIADHIIENIADKGRIKMILQETDLVTAITYNENNLINKSGFIKEMPPGSYENKDMFARYKMSGVEVPSKKIEVYGALKDNEKYIFCNLFLIFSHISWSEEKDCDLLLDGVTSGCS